MIVLMYIAIVAMIVVPRLTGVGRRANETNLRATLHELRAAIGSFQAETGLYPLTLTDLVKSEAPDTGLTETGLEVPIFEDDFRGPYLLASGGQLPIDRTTGKRDWKYETRPPHVGEVHSSNPKTSLDGIPYSEF
ncbi:MAG: type II secretion system protein [Candidatus Zipacnadales bacterium]